MHGESGDGGHRHEHSLGEEPLIKFNMNISQLNEYLVNLIQVVNQHARLL